MASFYQETLKRALTTLGDNALLAQRLGVSPDVLERWLSGLEMPPTASFMQAVDIVLGARRPKRPE